MKRPAFARPALLAVLLVASGRAVAAERCTVADPSGTPLNVRAEPVGGEDESLRKVTINVTEAKPFLLVYGLGYSTDRGASGLIEVTDLK